MADEKRGLVIVQVGEKYVMYEEEMQLARLTQERDEATPLSLYEHLYRFSYTKLKQGAAVYLSADTYERIPQEELEDLLRMYS